MSGRWIDGNRLTAALVDTRANQEHGIVSRSGKADQNIAQHFPAGAQLCVLPNHACATRAQFPEYHAVSGQKVGPTWPRFYGW